MTKIRYHVTPRDAPAAVAARVLGLTETAFTEKLPELERRGFPKKDPTTGFYDLAAIDAWCKLRHPQLFGLSTPAAAKDASMVVRDRLKVAGGSGRP